MLTSSDFLQAVRPAFIVYALAMASTGAALGFAPDDARHAAARTPAALQWVQRTQRSLAHPSAAPSVALAARPLRADFRTGVRTGFGAHAGRCAATAAQALPVDAMAAHGASVAGALAGLP
jgi:hypothetical protein